MANDDKVVPLIPKTKIPADPRERTKHHARIDFSVWVSIEDLAGYADAVDLLREGIRQLTQDPFVPRDIMLDIMKKAVGPDNVIWFSDPELRVGK